jgi:hypothetical protein
MPEESLNYSCSVRPKTLGQTVAVKPQMLYQPNFFLTPLHPDLRTPKAPKIRLGWLKITLEGAPVAIRPV